MPKSLSISLKTIKVYVSSCQNNTVDKFTTTLSTHSKLIRVQRFLLDQWMIAKHKFAQIPLREQIYTFMGRRLRLDASLDLYGITAEDTIYLRFQFCGPITVPYALSTDELRTALQGRKVYRKNQSPAALMQQLQIEIQNETRLKRLSEATVRGDTQAVIDIKEELKRNEKIRRQKQEDKIPVHLQPRPSSVVWPLPPTEQRTVFLSITELERHYQTIPNDVLDPSVCIFDADRTW